jgi:hypothetical protein
LEFVVALLLFGIAMSGLFPLVVMYSRVLELLEQRPNQLSAHRNADVDGKAYRVEHPAEWYQVPATPAVPNSGEWVHKWYLVPSSDSASPVSVAWARKLGASASIKFAAPTNRTEEPLAEPAKWDDELDAVGGGTNPNYTEAPGSDWSDESSADAWNGSQRRQPPGEAANATWTFAVPDDGWYRIEATGLVSGTPSAGCSYTLSYGDPPADVAVPLPATETFGASSTWSVLTTKYLGSGQLTVRLNAGASDSAIADGMRIVRCSVQIKTLTPPTTETATASVEITPAVRTP